MCECLYLPLYIVVRLCTLCTSCLYSHQNNAKKQKKTQERDKRKETKNKKDLQAHFKHHSIANSISIEQLNWCLDTLNTLHCSPLYFGNLRKAPFILGFSATTTKTPLTSKSINNSNGQASTMNTSVQKPSMEQHIRYSSTFFSGSAIVLTFNRNHSRLL